MNKRIVITTTAIALLAVAFAISAKGQAPTFANRFDAVREAPAVAIPHEALHAKALELLHSMPAAEVCVATKNGMGTECVPLAEVPVVAEAIPLPKADPRKQH